MENRSVSGRATRFWSSPATITKTGWFAAPQKPIRLLGPATPPEARVLRRLPPEIFRLLKTALIFARKGGAGLRIAEARTQEIFWRIWSLVPKKNLSPEMLRSGGLSDFSKRLSDLLARFPDRRLTISEMARAFGWSESHFAHQCRALIGVTPAKAALHFRLERAKELLLDSASGLREIALACGFASPFHFSRKFSLAFGASPLTWRKKYSKAIG